eukprot:TRINITY_DN49162_c0_g1_i1.p1 TRINITY_DN49162_c0_g1~~TRINITY_DN49162_c0_g1_i1.p1  ORF type:complete len:401 (-),score=71.68 TRINITY_DN49162_c0_g1_i1:44-1246(-)
MPVAPKKTADLIKSLCTDIGHEDGASACIKKVVQNNWIVDMNDLKQVPIETFEKWGLPLKLCYKLIEALADDAAADYWKGITSTVNYTLRPKLAKLQGGTVQFLQKKSNPREWAAIKMQNFYRKRQRIKALEAQQEEARLTQPDDDEVAALLGGEDFRRMDADEAHQVRVARAEDKIRRAVRRWKARRERRLRGEDTSSAPTRRFSLTLMSAMTPGVLGPPKDCEVADFLMKLGHDELGYNEGEVTGWVRMVVNQHWIEQMDDIDLIDERHWRAWEVPKKFSDKVKERTTTPAGRVIGSVAGGVTWALGAVFPCFAAKSEVAGPAWFCKTCGTRNIGDAGLCSSCGKPRDSAQHAAHSAASTPSPMGRVSTTNRRAHRASLRDRRRVSLQRESEEDTMTF